MDEIFNNMPSVISKEHEEIEHECGGNVVKKEVNASETAHNLLNLLAEVVVENMVKKIRNGCNRIHKDK